MTVPMAMDRATSRLGFFTSAAVNPMLFQASAEKSEPTWATASARSSPYQPPAAVTVGTNDFRKLAPGTMGCAPRIAQKCEKLSEIAEAFRKTNTHRKIRPRSESIFAEVKIF